MSQTFESTGSQQYRQPATGGQTTTGGQSVSGGQTATGAQSAGQEAGSVGRQFPTRSFLPDEVRTTSIGLLNQCLADLTAVNMQLKDAHWNVKGIHFYQLHELFEDLVETFEEHVDAVAERASALGGQPLGTARDVAATTTIPPVERGACDGRTVLEGLAHRLSILDASLHRALETADRQEDLDTADLINEVSRDVSKALWFVEAHLQGGASHGAGAAVRGATTSGGAMAGGETAEGEMAGFQSTTFGGGPSPDSQGHGTGTRH